MENSILNEAILRDINEATILFEPLPGTSQNTNVVIEEIIVSTHEQVLLDQVLPMKNPTPSKKLCLKLLFKEDIIKLLF